jgi:hypothetical protein
MDSLLLDSSELAALLNQLELDEMLGFESDQIQLQTATKDNRMLQEGLNRLIEKNLLILVNDQVETGAELKGFSETVINPQIMVKIFKETPQEIGWSLYYFSGSSIVEFSPLAPGQFSLRKIADLDEVAANIELMLPIEPVPESVQYQAEVPQEDADEIAALADGWSAVPALTILEADGLKTAEAKDLFLDLTDYQWWGWVDILTCENGQITKGRRVLVIQGQDRAWVARQMKPEVSTIYIETAQSGEFEKFLGQYWDEIG